MRPILLALALALAPLAAFAGLGTLTQHAITVDGVQRTYCALTPSGAVPGVPLPVIIALHGGGGTACTFVGPNKTNLAGYANANGFLLIAPQGLDGSWRHADAEDGSITRNAIRDAGDDLAFFAAIQATVIPAEGGDPARLYVTGVSAGGMMAYRLACQTPGGMQVRAIAVVATTMTLPPSKCPDAAGLSVLHIHGDADTRVPLAGGGGGLFSGVDYPPVWIGLDHIQTSDGCATAAIVPRPAPGVTARRASCPDGREVAFWVVAGGPHDWDVSPYLNETSRVLAFFLSH